MLDFKQQSWLLFMASLRSKDWQQTVNKPCNKSQSHKSLVKVDTMFIYLLQTPVHSGQQATALFILSC